MRFTIFFVFTLVFVNLCTGQNLARFEHLTTEDGLSQNDVNTIYQDRLGFMWFGTHDGLDKYDGYKFETYRPDINNEFSINSNLIYGIVGDENDNLWIGTTGNGLNFYDRETDKFTHFTHDVNDSKSLINNHIITIFLDSENKLWISTLEGVDMLDLNKSSNLRVFQHIKPSKNYSFSEGKINVIQFYEDSKNQLWLCELNGLSKIIKNNKTKKQEFIIENVNDQIGKSPHAVKCMGEDYLGRLVLGTTNGLYLLKEAGINTKMEIIKKGSYSQISIYEDKIWVGDGYSLFEFSINKNTGKIEFKKEYLYDPINSKISLTKSSIKSLFVDRTGIVWIGTSGGGISKLDPNRKKFSHFNKTISPTSLSVNNVKSIFEDSNGALWIGAEQGGLNVVSKKENNGTYQNFTNLLPGKSPVTIIEAKINNRKKLLIGAANYSGLYTVDIDNAIISKDIKIENDRDISKGVFSLLQDKKLNIWIGSYNGGIYRWILTDNNEYKKDILSNNKNDSTSIANNIIRDIVEDKNGDFWFATANGLCKLLKDESLKKNPKFITYKNNESDLNSLSNNYALTIFESRNGDIWIGTFGGLNKLIPATKNKQASFKVYNKKNGFPNDVIKGILEDEQGNLWVSTNGGLSKFNPLTENIENYDVNDGLQSNEFGELACLKRDNGEMIFGGVNGFNIFSPEKIVDNTFKATAVITNFLIFNKSVGIGEEINGRVILKKSIYNTSKIDLKHSENSFSFEFSSLHFAASKKNQFAYKLEGFNKDWIYTSSDMRFATYTNLEPGLYTLKVKASNNDGLWDGNPIELQINVIPPFWRTNVAKLFYVLLFFGLLFLFRRFTLIRSTKKYELELEHVEKEKHEEIHRLKLEFFTNISHEFRTPLTLIKGPLEYLKNLDDKLIPEIVREQHNLMHKNTDYLLRLVNQLLDFRKMDKGKMTLYVGNSNIVEFIKIVGEPFQFLSHKKNINFKINSKVKELLTWFDSNAVEKIMNNLLSNAFKFTPNNGEIKIDIFEGVDFIAPEGLKTKTDKSNYIVIQVKDSGKGIPQHRVKFIFERFYVERDVRKINSEGTGIGLAFTKNLVELHRGSIDVLSDEKKGTTFVIWLPKDKESYENINGIDFIDDEESNTFISQSNAESHAIGIIDDIVDQNITTKRSKIPVVLVVDDNADIRTFIKRGLGNKYDVYEAENGQRGFEFAEKLMPNIILTDILMPVMDGIEFCDKLKTTQETSHIPVIMLTAKISQEWEIEGLKTGADAYIRKPFDMELVKLKILNILKFREEMRKRFNRDITLQPKEVTVTSTDEIFLQKAIDIVEENMMNDDFSVEVLVKELSLSRSTLYLKIKELTGLSSGEFIRNIRLKRAVQLFDKSNLSVKEIMYMTGFNTASYFSKCFKKQFGVIPSKYVRQMGDKDKDPLI